MQGCIFFTTWLFGKLLWLFLPKFFLTSSFPLFFSFWCCLEFGPVCTTLLDYTKDAVWTTFCFEFFGLKVFPLFVHYWQSPLLFPFVLWKFLHTCGCSVPFFMAFSAVISFMGSAGLFIYQSTRGYISQPTVLELCFGPFFPVFHHRL